MNKRGDTGIVVLIIVLIGVIIFLFKYGATTTGSTAREMKEGCIDTDKPTDYEGRNNYNIYKQGSAYRYSTICLGDVNADCLSDTQKDICIEISLASNKVLNYVEDVRMHPGINYMRSGLRIVLSGDDPGTFGYNELTVDYYLAFMSWSLDLKDLKQLALNNI